VIDLNIDTSELSAEFNLTKQEVDGLLTYSVDEVSAQFAQQWATEVKSSLASTRSQYINAIIISKRDQFTNVVYLNPASWLANAIEMGASAFDMKKGLLASKKVKYTKKGKPYITVPFRFATPDAIGENGAFSGVMPQAVYKSVKNQAPKQSLSLNSIPSQYQIPKNIGIRKQVKSGNFKNLTAKTKMTSIYEGMQKSKGGYVTFRRVSLSSDAQSWNHPGFEARDFAGTALNNLNIPQIVDVSIDSYLSQLGF